MKTQFIDLHCHPAMKPFGKSFNRTAGQNPANRKNKASIWHYDPPTFIDKVANISLSITKFTQADFTTLSYGGAHIICASLYPLEKGFVLNKLGDNLPSDLMKNLVMGIGKKRIDYLQQMPDYFTDLENIYTYYKQLDGKSIPLEGQKGRYKLVSSFDEIEEDEQNHSNTIYVILTIEGANVFNSGLQSMGKQADEAEVLANIDKVKQWDHKLLFISLTHHFYNELCGHAKSMEGISARVSNQLEGLHTGFTPLGWKVLAKLLDNTDQRRILIDIKHLSPESRNEYYSYLDEHMQEGEIPLIVSHGAVNGFRSYGQQVVDNPATSGKFMDADINFFDDELIRIAHSGGIFGIQLDERRLGSKSEIKRAGRRISRRKMLFHRSKLLWNQIQHIAETLDRHEMFGWALQSIGSDFDGLVDPLNGFWGGEEMSLLDTYLEKHAFNYLNSELGKNLKSYNQIKADEVVERFMYSNAFDFLKRNF